MEEKEERKDRCSEEGCRSRTDRGELKLRRHGRRGKERSELLVVKLRAKETRLLEGRADVGRRKERRASSEVHLSSLRNAIDFQSRFLELRYPARRLSSCLLGEVRF